MPGEAWTPGVEGPHIKDLAVLYYRKEVRDQYKGKQAVLGLLKEKWNAHICIFENFVSILGLIINGNGMRTQKRPSRDC